MCLVIDSWRDIDTIVSIPLRKGTVEHRYELVLECFVAIDYFNRVRCQVRCQVLSTALYLVLSIPVRCT